MKCRNEATTKKPNIMKMQTIEQINKKICKALNVEYSEFVKMNFEGKNAIINQYTINVLGLKFKNHK